MRGVLRSALQGGYTTTTTASGTVVRVLHGAVNAARTAVVAPMKSRQCVAFTTQELYGGVWHTVSSAGYVRTTSASTAIRTPTGSHPLGRYFRFAALYRHPASDPAYLDTYGPWVYLLFRA